MLNLTKKKQYSIEYKEGLFYETKLEMNEIQNTNFTKPCCANVSTCNFLCKSEQIFDNCLLQISIYNNVY